MSGCTAGSSETETETENLPLTIQKSFFGGRRSTQSKGEKREWGLWRHVGSGVGRTRERDIFAFSTKLNKIIQITQI